MKIDSSIPVFDTSAVQPGHLGDPQKHRELIQAVRSVNSADLLGGNELRFALDQETQRAVIKILNRETQEIVEQIPAERVLQLAKSLSLLQTDRGPSQE
jgi:flagellar protein FlaG